MNYKSSFFSAEEETNLDRILNQALDAGDGANVSFELGEMVNDDFDEFFRWVKFTYFCDILIHFDVMDNTMFSDMKVVWQLQHAMKLYNGLFSDGHWK